MRCLSACGTDITDLQIVGQQFFVRLGLEQLRQILEADVNEFSSASADQMIMAGYFVITVRMTLHTYFSDASFALQLSQVVVYRRKRHPVPAVPQGCMDFLSSHVRGGLKNRFQDQISILVHQAHRLELF